MKVRRGEINIIIIIMNIYDNLTSEIQNKFEYMVLQHPIAKIIKDEIQRLHCAEYFTFKDRK